MRKLQLKYFKAFKDELIIDFANKNFLLYGENGSGKSSIFEALKIIFFKSKIDASIPNASTPEEQQQITNDFWSKYNNKVTNRNFEIKVNDIGFESFSSGNYQVFMVSLEDTRINNSLKLSLLLKKFYLNIPDLDLFCFTNYATIQEEVNKTVHSFNETFQIEIDNEDDFSVKFIDPIKRIESKVDINVYFNEAKLNLVVLLLIFQAIKISQLSSKKRILILDDFITSLDASNRTFLLKYILTKFPQFQILIFTHNVSFYNLVVYMTSEIYKGKTNIWHYANIYEINNSSKLYFRTEIEKAKAIQDSYKQISSVNNNSQQVEEIGNRIRQKFEIFLYEFSKLTMIGGVEESKKILERINNSKNLYIHNNNTASDLVDEIISILSEPNNKRLRVRLFTIINKYRYSDFKNFKFLIRELKLYQKVTMHPMSHGSLGQSSFTTSEIEKSLELLLKLESQLKDLVRNNVDSV
jgi:ABC-type dipeptide/oligopeptide/nickel transport system, ATPase component